MLVDLSLPLKSGMIFRNGSPAVFLNEIDCYHESEGNYKTHILSMPLHSGTHIDLVDKTKKLSPEKFTGQGMVLDVRGITDRDIGLPDVETKKLPAETRFLFFLTGWDERIGHPDYFRHPQLSMEVVEWIAAKNLFMVGIDALGLGRDSKHGVFDRYLAGRDIFIIENLRNLQSLPAEPFQVCCLPLSIDGVEALPARVVAVI